MKLTALMAVLSATYRRTLCDTAAICENKISPSTQQICRASYAPRHVQGLTGV